MKYCIMKAWISDLARCETLGSVHHRTAGIFVQLMRNVLNFAQTSSAKCLARGIIISFNFLRIVALVVSDLLFLFFFFFWWYGIYIVLLMGFRGSATYFFLCISLAETLSRSGGPNISSSM